MTTRTRPSGATAAPTPTEALTAFRQYTMAHPRLKEMHEQILRAIREPGGASLLFILGPTGVGKTTLVARLMQQITSDLLEELAQDRERMAVAGMEAEAPALGNYDFKQHFKRSLKALGEILVDRRIETHRHTLEARQQGMIIVHGLTTAAALRGSLEDSLQRRRPAAFFIDEAHHLSKVTGMRKFQDHLDVIKSLANVTGTLHVLVGTYELQALLNLSDQLSRRSRTFHFERYRLGQASDVKIFQNILWNLQERLPFARQQDLREHSAYLMERSLGCVGILKGWFVRAAALALIENADSLTLSHLQRHQPTDAEWRSMATALLEGEESLHDSGLEMENLRCRLQAETGASATPEKKRGLTVVASTTATPARSRRRPGERRPARDPIGKK